MNRFHKVPISASISYINREGKAGEFYTHTLSRDVNSSQKRQQIASLYNSPSYIKDNTDFAYIIETIKDTPIDKVYYYNNSIPFNLRYKNSHIHEAWAKRYYSWYGLIPRLFNWKLPYRSTIVVPILPPNNQKPDSIEGFLCVDSPKMWVFSKRYDVPILKEMAASLHPAIKRFNSKGESIMKQIRTRSKES